MTNWGGTWPDGRKIEPAPGMLVALQDGTWGVITDVSGIPATHYALNHDGGHWYRDYNMTPLAPPPQPGGLWNALGNVGGNDVSTISNMVVIHNDVARSHVIFDNSRYVRCEFSVTQPRRLTDNRLPLLDTAIQHHRALLAYCAQPGWEQ